MPKKPESKNLIEFNGTIELRPSRFEKVSDQIIEAKSYLSSVGEKLSGSLTGEETFPAEHVRSAIGHLAENIKIAGEQAENLNPEAAAALDILSWIIAHGEDEASGVISKGPLSATAWHRRKIESVTIFQGTLDDELYLSANQVSTARLKLFKNTIDPETFSVARANVYSPRPVETIFRKYQGGAIAITSAPQSEKSFSPRVRSITHKNGLKDDELLPTEATVVILPGTEIRILGLDEKGPETTKWEANWLDFLGTRSQTSSLTANQYPINFPDDECEVGPINLINKAKHRSLEIKVDQLGQFPLYKDGLSIGVKAGKVSRKLKIRPGSLPETISLPGEISIKKTLLPPEIISEKRDKKLRLYVQALLDMTEVEVVSK